MHTDVNNKANRIGPFWIGWLTSHIRKWKSDIYKAYIAEWLWGKVSRSAVKLGRGGSLFSCRIWHIMNCKAYKQRWCLETTARSLDCSDTWQEWPGPSYNNYEDIVLNQVRSHQTWYFIGNKSWKWSPQMQWPHPSVSCLVLSFLIFKHEWLEWKHDQRSAKQSKILLFQSLCREDFPLNLFQWRSYVTSAALYESQVTCRLENGVFQRQNRRQGKLQYVERISKWLHLVTK